MLLGTRELSPAVRASFDAFWTDAPGPGGVGIQARYLAMLSHVAARFARYDAVAGYDLMNEPNALFFWWARARARRSPVLHRRGRSPSAPARPAVGAPRRLIFFEPSIIWSDYGFGAPLPFTDDDQIVYSPHIYQGGINSLPLGEAAFQQALDEAASLFGGAPILVGEWGSDPRRAEDPGDDYFELHQALQDQFRFGATLWTWREACGDPHKAGDVRAGVVPYVWGLFDVDCATQPGGRDARGAPGRAAPPGAARSSRPGLRRRVGSGGATLRGAGRERDRRARASWCSGRAAAGRRPGPTRRVCEGVHAVHARGGHHFVVGWSRGGAWDMTLEDRR